MQGTNQHKANNSYFSPKTQQVLNLRLTISPCSPYAFRTVAKSTVSREKLNIYLANDCTPLNRAFFVRSIRTPKERLKMACSSMVAFDEQGFALDCLPDIAVFSPRQTLSPYTVRSEAIAPKNLYLELSAMIYLLQCVNRYAPTYQEKIVFIQAPNADEMRFKLDAQFALLSIVAQYPDHLAQQAVQKFARLQQRLAGAFTTEQNHSLPTVQNADNLESTTTLDGNRNRYTSGIFLPKIFQTHGIITPVIYSDLAVRATPRNKADTIRTNKGGYSSVAVEPLSHPFSDKPLSLTRTLETMNKPTQTQKGIIAKLTAFPFLLSAEKGACYA